MDPEARAWLAHGNEVRRECSYLGEMDAIALGCLTILALGTCMLIGPGPLLSLGQRSYGIYLTHMFVVLAVLSLFVAIGRPVSGVPSLCVRVVPISGVWGGELWHGSVRSRSIGFCASDGGRGLQAGVGG